MTEAAGSAGRRRAARRAVAVLLGHLRGGIVDVADAEGSTRYGQPDASDCGAPLRAQLVVHHPDLYERVLRRGSTGLGEAYADGWWDADDLTAFLRIALRSMRRTFAARDWVHRALSPALDPIARLRRADADRDARNVRSHYDLGNEFFELLLDETMAYSCAVFDTPTTPLADASRAKFDRLAHMLALAPGDRLVEIGTGWGGFALHAAEEYGCLVTTTTVSARQYEFARDRVQASGLEDRVTVLDDDYRSLRGTFDKAIAIEMIEAVDWRDYETFFRCMRGLLTDEGALAMQAIVLPDESFDRVKRHTDFIAATIFPGGCLPSVGALTGAARRGGFTLHALADIGMHYGETLRRWRANLRRGRPRLPAIGLDERFARLWDFYFSYCEAGFEERYLSDVQLLYAAPGFDRTTATTVTTTSPANRAVR